MCVHVVPLCIGPRLKLWTKSSASFLNTAGISVQGLWGGAEGKDGEELKSLRKSTQKGGKEELGKIRSNMDSRRVDMIGDEAIVTLEQTSCPSRKKNAIM